MLQAVPDNIKAEAAAAWKLSVTHLLFTLFVKFQPGGQGERVTLIRFLTELKTMGSMVEIAQNLRQWRRWWNRAQELAVMLPDPVILAGVLTQASDAIAKSGAQAATGCRCAGNSCRLIQDPTWTPSRPLQSCCRPRPKSTR